MCHAHILANHDEFSRRSVLQAEDRGEEMTDLKADVLAAMMPCEHTETRLACPP
jgi:hypothetical protein